MKTNCITPEETDELSHDLQILRYDDLVCQKTGIGLRIGTFIGRKEGNVLFNDAFNTFLFTVIWRRTYGKGPLR